MGKFFQYIREKAWRCDGLFPHALADKAVLGAEPEDSLVAVGQRRVGKSYSDFDSWSWRSSCVRVTDEVATFLVTKVELMRIWCNIAPQHEAKDERMARQSISLTKPNDDWLKSMVDSEEYVSKSEVVNDLIRQAREIDMIRAKLEAAELAGFSPSAPTEIRDRVRARLRGA